MIRIHWQPTARELRIFAIGQFVFIGIVLLGFVRRGGSPTVATAIAAVSAVIGLIGVAQPALIRHIYIVWMIVVFPIGWIITNLLLAGTFLCVIIPLGFVVRCFGVDPISRRFEPGRSTYWTRRRPTPPTTRYFRQF